MASKRAKPSLKQSKSRKREEQPLETAEDYLAQGVDDEEAMGKHRAGAPGKAFRFAQKALILYNEGLTRYPSNFDLAYNKARLELEVATHPMLLGQLQVPLTAALREALASHRYALELNPDNADLLFNTAQVLSTIAEEMANNEEDSMVQAIQLLREAFDLQTKCLGVQRTAFVESQSQREQALARMEQQFDEDASGGVRLDEPGDARFIEQREEDSQWVSVLEPVTQDTLQDTYLAQLHTLTAMCSIVVSILSGASELDEDGLAAMALVEAFSVDVPVTAERQAEIALAKANLRSVFLEAAYRSKRINAVAYQEQRNATFTGPDLLLDSFDYHASVAKSLIALNVAVQEIAEGGSSIDHDATQLAEIRWSALSSALTTLTSASKLKGVSNDELASTHLLRGDVSLLCYRLGEAPWLFRQAVLNAGQLLKNAEVFYRNAAKLYSSVAMTDLSDVAHLRCAVSQALQSSSGGATALGQVNASIPGGSNRPDAWKQRQLEEMIDEGLIPGGTF